jgi:hypothetical protein
MHVMGVAGVVCLYEYPLYIYRLLLYCTIGLEAPGKLAGINPIYSDGVE